MPHPRASAPISQGLCKVASDGLAAVLGVAGLSGVAGSGRRSRCARERRLARLGGGGPDEPGRPHWTVTVVPAQVATTALDRHCRPDNSTRYFAVVGGARGARPVPKVISPNHSNRPTWDPCRWTTQRPYGTGRLGGATTHGEENW